MSDLKISINYIRTNTVLTSLGSVSGMASSSETEPPVFLCGSEVVIATGSG